MLRRIGVLPSRSRGRGIAAMFVVWVGLVVFGQNAQGQTPPVLVNQPQPSRDWLYLRK